MAVLPTVATSELNSNVNLVRMKKPTNLTIRISAAVDDHIPIEETFIPVGWGFEASVFGGAAYDSKHTKYAVNANDPIAQSDNSAYFRARINTWRIQVAGGDATAAYNLGIALFRGEQGVKRDPQEAIRYFRIAAHEGNVNALFNLGWSYANGTGVEQNWSRAVRWWQLAAQKGHGSSARNIALLYSLGIAPSPSSGVARVDHQRAIFWYRQACALGNYKAHLALANCYRTGQGVEADADLAAEYEEKGKRLQREQEGQNGSQGPQ